MAPRNTLKGYFKKSLIPKESDFAELIDSVLVQNDDGLFKAPNGPLSVRAAVTDEALLNFLGPQAQAGDATPTWQLKQRPGGKAGLSIGDGTDGRLFIEQGTGRVGVGTTEPKSPLSVAGALALGADYAKTSAPPNGLIVEGRVGIGTAAPQTALHVNGQLRLESSALDFNGTSAYVTLPTMNPDYANGFTVEAWVLLRSLKNWTRMLDLAAAGATQSSIIFTTVERSATLALQWKDGDQVGELKATEAIELGVWMHLAATMSIAGNNGTVTLYKNGKQIAQSTTTKLIRTAERSSNFIGKSNNNLSEFLDGQVRDVRIWNVARTAAEIHDNLLAALTGKENGLVGYWPLDSANQAHDLGPQALHATASNTSFATQRLALGNDGISTDAEDGHSIRWRVLSGTGLTQAALSPNQIWVNVSMEHKTPLRTLGGEGRLLSITGFIFFNTRQMAFVSTMDDHNFLVVDDLNRPGPNVSVAYKLLVMYQGEW
jgi:hypothetical protein